MIEPSVDVDALTSIQRSEKFTSTRELMAELDSLLESLGISGLVNCDVIAARDLSLSAHFVQKDRPDGQPYVIHPIEVTLAVANSFGLTSPEALKAALLHDCVEDRPGRVIRFLGGDPSSSANLQRDALSLIGERFGARVAKMIGCLTNPDFDEMVMKAHMAGNGASDTELTVRFYKEHFLSILAKDPEAFLIKLADFSRNAFHLGNLPDGPKKDWFRAKYGPVVLATAEQLEKITDPRHPCANIRDRLIAELREVYARDYAQS